MNKRDTEIGGANKDFPNTKWTDVLELKHSSEEQKRNKIGQFISLYWKPVYWYARFHWNKSNEDAKDLTQGFFAKFFEKDLARYVNQGGGRFRTFIRTVLDNYLKDILSKDTAQKRGGGKLPVYFSDIETEPPYLKNTTDPAELFDKEWAKGVITRATITLKEKLINSSKPVYFEIFKDYYYPDNNNKPDQSLIATKYGVKLTDVKNYLHYTRRLLRDIIREEISNYCESEKEIEEEIRYLLSINF